MPDKREFMHMEVDIESLLSKTTPVPDTEIRDAMPEDAATLGRLYAQAYFELMDQLPPPRSETVEDFTKAMMDLFIKTSQQTRKDEWDVFRWIAEYCGRPVGFIVTGVTEDRGYVGEIGVLPSYRRKGIAQALLHGFAGFLKDRGVQVVQLDVNVENVPAIRLYQSCGFKKTHTWRSSQK